MKLIVGLGNPDKKLNNTYHNMGFNVIDRFADEYNYDFTKTKCKAKVCEDFYEKEKIILAKPQTYMNLSGTSVCELVKKFKIDLKDILVIFDDIDIEKGEAKFKMNGSGGTHNGMRNIVTMLGSTEFKRLKIGIKPSEKPKDLADYVLSRIDKGDWYEQAMEIAIKKIKDFINEKC